MGVLFDACEVLHLLYTAIACMEGAASSGDDGAYLNVCTVRSAPCAEWLNGSCYQFKT